MFFNIEWNDFFRLTHSFPAISKKTKKKNEKINGFLAIKSANLNYTNLKPNKSIKTILNLLQTTFMKNNNLIGLNLNVMN